MTIEHLKARIVVAVESDWRQLPSGAWTHRTASIEASATISDWVAIGSYAEIGSGAKIGSYAEIGSGAEIGSDAEIGSYAKIGSYAEIGSGAKIGSYAEIGSGAKIPRTPFQILGTANRLLLLPDGQIQIGCQTHDVAWWQANGSKLAVANDYTAAQIAEYGAYVHFIADHLAILNHGMGKVDPVGEAVVVGAPPESVTTK